MIVCRSEPIESCSREAPLGTVKSRSSEKRYVSKKHFFRKEQFMERDGGGKSFEVVAESQ